MLSKSHTVPRGSVTALPMRIDHDTAPSQQEVHDGTRTRRTLAGVDRYQCPSKCDDCYHGKPHRHITDCNRDPRSSTSVGCPMLCIPVAVPAPDPRRCDACAMYEEITASYRGYCTRETRHPIVRKAFTAGRRCWIERKESKPAIEVQKCQS